MYLYPSLKTCITMATNKHAAIRYKVLDICLSNRARKFTFEDLLNACNEALQEINPDDAGIGIRTLRDDLKHMLNITYQSYRNPEPIQMVIHPYHLRQYNNRWFLFGLHNDLQKISTLALDRIVDTEENTQVPYTESTLFDPNDYFEDIIGVSRMEGSQLQRIVLFFRKDAAPYVLSKPLHGSQKVISRSEEGATVSIEVIPNFELETVILSHGERVKVLEPEDFRLKIEQRFSCSLRA